MYYIVRRKEGERTNGMNGWVGLLDLQEVGRNDFEPRD